MPQRSSNKVKVYVRTRPTNNFAADMISMGRDNRVSSHKNFLFISNYNLNRQSAFIELHQLVLLIIKSMIGHSI
jgi:hypothetical protein